MNTLRFDEAACVRRLAGVESDGEDAQMRPVRKQFFLVNPEVHGGCDERHNWLEELFWDLDECRDLKKMDPEAKEDLLWAASNLIETLGIEANAFNMSVAWRWILDFVEEANWGDMMEGGIGAEPYWRLREFVASEPAAKAKILAFRNAMSNLGIKTPA